MHIYQTKVHGSHSLDRGSPRGSHEVAGLAGAAGVVHEGHLLDLDAHAALEGGRGTTCRKYHLASRRVIDVQASGEISCLCYWKCIILVKQLES